MVRVFEALVHPHADNVIGIGRDAIDPRFQQWCRDSRPALACWDAAIAAISPASGFSPLASMSSVSMKLAKIVANLLRTLPLCVWAMAGLDEIAHRCRFLAANRDRVSEGWPLARQCLEQPPLA